MIRVLIYFIVLAAIAYGCMLLIQNPGHIELSWYGEVIDAPAALALLAIAAAAIILWTILRLVFGLPSMIAFASRQRRREKGYSALSRGLVAVGSGDAYKASRASDQASRHLKNDPLAIMLQAQSAHLNGDERGTQAAFAELARREDTRILGLRGLYAEATRRGDEEAARQFAFAAHKTQALPWSSQAVLEHRASESDWEQALQAVEAAIAARHVDKATGMRQRAVLETALAQQKAGTAPDEALSLAKQAMKHAPDLAPAVVIAAEVLSRRGDIRKASKLIEKAWPDCQHPDVAQAYLDVRSGDSTRDRLSRAKTLMGIASVEPVGRTTVARAALANKDFGTARSAMEPLIVEGRRPTVRECTLMADIEEAEFGDHGQWREWLARAARAPFDPAWIADGIVYDQWAPVSPTTGRLDAFKWQVPAERVGPALDAGTLLPRSRETALQAARERLRLQTSAEQDGLGDRQPSNDAASLALANGSGTGSLSESAAVPPAPPPPQPTAPTLTPPASAPAPAAAGDGGMMRPAAPVPADPPSAAATPAPPIPAAAPAPSLAAPVVAYENGAGGDPMDAELQPGSSSVDESPDHDVIAVEDPRTGPAAVLSADPWQADQAPGPERQDGSASRMSRRSRSDVITSG